MYKKYIQSTLVEIKRLEVFALDENNRNELVESFLNDIVKHLIEN